MIRLGVSACLLGESVRYDGGHKRDAFLTDVLGPHVKWIPVCPEGELDGYVLKRASPSCGLLRVRVYRETGAPSAAGRGLFATALRDLVALHAAQKYAVLAHSPPHYTRLGRLVATAGPRLQRADAAQPRVTRYSLGP